MEILACVCRLPGEQLLRPDRSPEWGDRGAESWLVGPRKETVGAPAPVVSGSMGAANRVREVGDTLEPGIEAGLEGFQGGGQGSKVKGEAVPQFWSDELETLVFKRLNLGP